MSALTTYRMTPEYENNKFVTLTAGGTIQQGGMVAVNGSGAAVAASDTSGLKVIGRAENKAASGEKVPAPLPELRGIQVNVVLRVARIQKPADQAVQRRARAVLPVAHLRAGPSFPCHGCRWGFPGFTRNKRAYALAQARFLFCHLRPSCIVL